MLRWVEIDLWNIAANVRYIRSIAHRETKIISVVKADAYGHGAVEVGRTVLKNGADILAVANVYEAMELRKAGIKVPVLILNWTEPERLKDIIRDNLTQTIFDLDSARALSSTAKKMHRVASVHIKIDTGMGRLGMSAENAAAFIRKAADLPNLKINGIISHLSVAEKEHDYTEGQFRKFMSVLGGLRKEGIEIPVQHIANSAATLAYPYMHLAAVRPGIIIYGISPWGMKKKCKFLRPAMSFKTKIVSIKEVPKGTSISYGRTFITKRRSLIADIPVGYAQGYNRNLSNKSRVLVNGKRVPIAGRVCMDQCLIDITGVKGVEVGDEVVLFGRQGKGEISAEELASWAGTIGYEIVSTVGRLVPRIYKKSL
jgi:alanine racemase